MNDLYKVGLLISEWRQSKRYAGEKMPENLWNLACDLTKNHPIHVVANELKITGTELRRQLAKRQRSSQLENKTQKPDVRPLSPPKHESTQPQFIAEIFIQPNMTIRIHSSVAEKDLKLLLALAREVA